MLMVFMPRIFQKRCEENYDKPYKELIFGFIQIFLNYDDYTLLYIFSHIYYGYFITSC